MRCWSLVLVRTRADARPPMELAKGVRDLAKDGVATVQAHLSADSSPHSPAAPLRYRRNMEAVVVEDCYHNVRRNELPQLHPTCPEPARRAEMVRGLAPREFELLWLNSSEVKVSNLHRREKPVKLRVDPEQGVTLERAETKKAEEERQVGCWHCGTALCRCWSKFQPPPRAHGHRGWHPFVSNSPGLLGCALCGSGPLQSSKISRSVLQNAPFLGHLGGGLRRKTA